MKASHKPIIIVLFLWPGSLFSLAALSSSNTSPPTLTGTLQGSPSLLGWAMTHFLDLASFFSWGHWVHVPWNMDAWFVERLITPQGAIILPPDFLFHVCFPSHGTGSWIMPVLLKPSFTFPLYTWFWDSRRLKPYEFPQPLSLSSC